MRQYDLDVLEPRKDPDGEPDMDVCSHCGHKLLAIEDECSFCATERELDEDFDDIDDLTMGERI